MSRTARSVKPAAAAKLRRSTNGTKQPSSRDIATPETVTVIEPHAGRAASVFAINEVVSVPITVHESKQARIAGMEWGPSRGVKAKEGWLYYIDLGGGPAWEATEKQLVEWGNGK